MVVDPSGMRYSSEILSSAAADAHAPEVQLLIERLESERLQRGDAAETSLWDGSGEQGTEEEIPAGKKMIAHGSLLMGASIYDGQMGL